MSEVAIYTAVQVSVQVPVFNSYVYVPGSGFGGPHAILWKMVVNPFWEMNKDKRGLMAQGAPETHRGYAMRTSSAVVFTKREQGGVQGKEGLERQVADWVDTAERGLGRSTFADV